MTPEQITFDFACLDDCLDRMVPSDLRQLVSQRDRLVAEVARLKGLPHRSVDPYAGYAAALAEKEQEDKEDEEIWLGTFPITCDGKKYKNLTGGDGWLMSGVDIKRKVELPVGFSLYCEGSAGGPDTLISDHSMIDIRCKVFYTVPPATFSSTTDDAECGKEK